MAQVTSDVVHKPFRVRERSTRALDQRLGLRFPRLTAAYGRLIGRLAPTSRLRQALLWRAVRQSGEAFNRRDVDAFLLNRRPDCEWYPPREFVEAGFFKPCYRGPPGYREYVSAWSDVVGDIRVETIEVIDLGTRIVSLAHLRGQAKASGVPLTRDYATVSTLSGGRAIREQQYLDHGEALEAVGLRE
jgi:ketosteroid isomerase-like protein